MIYSSLFSQHNYEFYNNGAVIQINSGAELHVLGDIHMTGVTGQLSNYGLIVTQGNSYSNNFFQQRGTGTYRIQNSQVNVGQRQFISGNFAVRGGQANIGVNDGSFYNLELGNDQGIVYLVGTGNVADVRNSVDFNVTGLVNKIITHDIGISGAITYPINGSNYAAIFGMMNSAVGLSNFTDNTISANGNMSSIDNGYIQGKLRRAINPAGGMYNFIVGLEPAGVSAKRGVQYMTMNIGANDFNVLDVYFESASSNMGVDQMECSGSPINYWGGSDHGEWIIENLVGGSTGSYSVQVWPQDHTLMVGTYWVITKNDAISGNADQCGPTTVGLLRGGFTGFGEFGVASGALILPVGIIDLSAQGMDNKIEVSWEVINEANLNHYELERSLDGILFEHLANISPSGTSSQNQTYKYDDYKVKAFQNYYYRLKSFQNDGQISNTSVVMASIISENNGFNIELFPNPSYENFKLTISSSNNEAIQMHVLNSLGQIIHVQDINITNGNNLINIDSKYWKAGVYNIKFSILGTDKLITKRFIKY